MTLKPVTSKGGTLLGWIYGSDDETEQLMREVLLKETLAQMSRERRRREAQPPPPDIPIQRWTISDRH
tara:strand:- start:29 stop:232 length:204 start_codon:yes stop_codon:yes gene_type:complete